MHEHGPGAVLLEELTPGTPLLKIVEDGRDPGATTILAGVIRKMAEASPPTEGFPTTDDWAQAFDGYLSTGDEQIPRALVEDARRIYADLGRSQTAVRLLHGDLHHENILYDENRGWVAIDPKGVVGEPEYELGAALRNPSGFPDLYASAPAVARRVGQFAEELGARTDRTLAWAYAQAVLSAVWLVEDEGSIDPSAPALRLAEAVRPLVTGGPGENG